jgi:hypothetical protein
LRSLSTLALLIASVIGSVGVARADEHSGRVIAVPNSPVTLQTCSWTTDDSYIHVLAFDRASADSTAFTFRVQAFDSSGKMLGSGVFTVSDAPLSSGDSAVSKQFYNGTLQVPNTNNVASMTCRIQTAEFGGKTWKYGQTWKGKLLPLPSPAP